MFKAIASGLLLTMASGLIATLWGFHSDIIQNRINIQGIQKQTNNQKDDLHYIRDRVDKIHEYLIKRKN